MSNKVLITEDGLKEIIKEELGIASEVLELTKKIEQKIDSSIKNGKYSGTFKIKDDLKIRFKYFDFADYESLNDWYRDNFNKVKNGYSFKSQTIYITILAVNSIFDSYELLDTIQHEVHHYFQAFKSGKTFSSDAYKTIVANLYSKNEYISCLSHVLYLNKKFEIEGFVNGAYNSFQNRKVTTYKDFIRNTNLSNVDKTLKNAFLFFKNEPFIGNDFNKMLTYIYSNGLYKESKSLKELRQLILKDCKNAYDMFIRKSSRAYALLKKNYDEMMIEHIKSKFNKDLI